MMEMVTELKEAGVRLVLVRIDRDRPPLSCKSELQANRTDKCVCVGRPTLHGRCRSSCCACTC